MSPKQAGFQLAADSRRGPPSPASASSRVVIVTWEPWHTNFLACEVAIRPVRDIASRGGAEGIASVQVDGRGVNSTGEDIHVSKATKCHPAVTVGVTKSVQFLSYIQQ